jgi:Xaa-Pro aminopeptidase
VTGIVDTPEPPATVKPKPCPQPTLAERHDEVERRISLVRDALGRADAEGALLRLRHNFAWLTAGGVNHVVLTDEHGAAPLLVTQEEAVVLAPANEAARLRDEELGELPIELVELPWFEPETVMLEAERRSAGRVAGDEELEETLWPVRAVLSPIEEQRLAWLGERARYAVQATLASAERGDTEDAISGELLKRLASDGVRAPVLLAAVDDRIARYRHPLPGEHAVRGRLMLVLVAERWGLHVALSRLRELAPPDPETSRRIAAAGEVLAAMLDATRAGNTLGDVFDTASAVYARLGFPDEWRVHHQGGLIGYRTRERIAVPGDQTPIVPGMALAWNPSITGAKAEETVFLGRDGRLCDITADRGLVAT